MEGTQSPIKIPASFSPLNQRNSENINESNAEASISKSPTVNFLNIIQ
jgi:hypothetical protein